MCAFRMFRRYRLFDNNGRIFEPYPFRCDYSNAEGDDVLLAPNPFGKNDESLAVTD